MLGSGTSGTMAPSTATSGTGSGSEGATPAPGEPRRLPRPRRRVALVHDPDAGNFSFGRGHPMQPHRERLAYTLMLAYGLVHKVDAVTPRRATFKELTRFHTDDYINFLRKLTPESAAADPDEAAHCTTTGAYAVNVEEDGDNPPFDGVFEFCQAYAGATLAAARQLNRRLVDTAIHWGGGFTHARRDHASAFCFINDTVLAILELLKCHRRVLYVDLDVFHCDAVEEAFYTTDRVMTVSLHQYLTGAFPGTGDVRDIGVGNGKYCAVNVPLIQGIDDESYLHVFRQVLRRVMERYKPDAIVVGVSPGGLAGDRYGIFNLTLDGLTDAVLFLQKFNLPMLLLGGGSSSSANASRLWTYVTARLLHTVLPDEIPYHEYFEYYAPRYRLSVLPGQVDNANTRALLDVYIRHVLDNLGHVVPASSGPMIVPEDALLSDTDDEPVVDDTEAPAVDGEPATGTAPKPDGEADAAPAAEAPAADAPAPAPTQAPAPPPAAPAEGGDAAPPSAEPDEAAGVAASPTAAAPPTTAPPSASSPTSAAPTAAAPAAPAAAAAAPSLAGGKKGRASAGKGTSGSPEVTPSTSPAGSAGTKRPRRSGPAGIVEPPLDLPPPIRPGFTLDSTPIATAAAPAAAPAPSAPMDGVSDDGGSR